MYLHRHRLLGWMLILLVMPVNMLGQQPAGQKLRAQPAVGSDKQGSPLISIDFAGGTLTEYVASIRKQQHGVNVVVDPEIASVLLPPVSLQNVSSSAAVNWIQLTASARKKNVSVQAVPRPPQSGGDDVFVISALESPLMGSPDRIQQLTVRNQIKAISLKPIVEGKEKNVTVDSVLSAVNTALEMQNPQQQDKATAKFDKATNLLFIRGTADQINTTMQVIDEMTRQTKTDARDLIIKNLEQDVDRLKAELANQKQRGEK